MSTRMEKYESRPGSLGVLLQQARTEQGSSLRQVAARAGLSYSLIQRLEAGIVRHPSPGKLVRLADALGLSVADVFAHAGYHTPKQLPGIRAYLAVRHPQLSGAAITELEHHLNHLLAATSND